MNPILNTDSYKASHWLQYPPGTENVFSYIESRGGVYDGVLFYGLQMYLKEYLCKPVTEENIVEAEAVIKAHGEPFNRQGWEKLLNKHGGYMPLCIKAVPEGTFIPNSNALVTVEATDPEFFWLPSYIETGLLRAVWYPTTVATISFFIKKLIKSYLEETGDVATLPFKLHDFGARGVSSFESAGIGGSAHLVSFSGTDNISALLHVRKYYNEPEIMPGYSIPAAEHSTITAYGKENEVEAYRQMLKNFAKPGSIVAVVSDSYDIDHAVSELWGKELKQAVIDSGATIVIRPDSGYPATVVLEVAKRLDASYGSTINFKGYKVLNHVRIIQGDGIELSSIKEILHALASHRFSADNITFGMGGALLQKLDRDTQMFAMKASAIKISGIWNAINKSPKGSVMKASKAGRLRLYKDALGKYTTTVENLSKCNELCTVFLNGELTMNQKFSEIRKHSELCL